jgi:hypothetical protein
MALLLVILIPLGALVIYAVVYDLKRRRRRGAVRSQNIRPHRAPVMSGRSLIRWRQAPSITPVAIGQPAARAWS